MMRLREREEKNLLLTQFVTGAISFSTSLEIRRLLNAGTANIRSVNGRNKRDAPAMVANEQSAAEKKVSMTSPLTPLNPDKLKKDTFKSVIGINNTLNNKHPTTKTNAVPRVDYESVGV